MAVHEMDHPLILHKLSLMRDKQTGVKEFREATKEIAMLMCYEATRDLPLKTIEIETPVAHAKVRVISGKKIAIVPILRAGLGMVDGMLELGCGHSGAQGYGRQAYQADVPAGSAGRPRGDSEGASGRGSLCRGD